MDDMILEVTGSPRGFAGPVGIRAQVIADYSLLEGENFVVGANREDYHLKNANPDRDYAVSAYADLRVVLENDPCPRCGAPIRTARGIEVGHVFKLGDKYSRAMRAVFLDAAGSEKTMIMGCYGIGIGRTVAAAIEQSHDDQGIVWPMTLAPYQVIVTPVNIKEAPLAAAAEALYRELTDGGVETLLDDRDERAGVKFKDADLIGIPLRITLGPKKLSEGCVELRIRRTGEVRTLPIERTVEAVREHIRSETEALI
jgi:prolyl-tRNA synthetase